MGSSMARDRVGKWSWRVGMPAAWTGPFAGGEEEQGLAAGGRPVAKGVGTDHTEQTAEGRNAKEGLGSEPSRTG